MQIMNHYYDGGEHIRVVCYYVYCCIVIDKYDSLVKFHYGIIQYIITELFSTLLRNYSIHYNWILLQ